VREVVSASMWARMLGTGGALSAGRNAAHFSTCLGE